MQETNKLMEVYARLKGLRENIPQTNLVDVIFADEFESLRQLLEETSCIALDGFRLEERAYERAKDFCMFNRGYLLARIDGLLNFFELQWSDPKPKIGFHP